MKRINVEWVKLEKSENEVLHVPLEGGVYIFLFNNYPFYVGTAESGNLSARLDKHQLYFKTLKRTYLDEEYFEKYTPWTKGLIELDEFTFFEKVYVPGISMKKINDPKNLKFSEEKSMEFWNGLEIYFGKIDDSNKEIIITLEKKIQLFLFAQNSTDHNYKKLHIPETTSNFFGKQEPGNFHNEYEFIHNTEKIEGSALEVSTLKLLKTN